MTATDRVLEALRARGSKVKGAGSDKWRAQCPAHDGTGLNLAVAKGDQGAVVKCWSHGCTEHDIAASLSLTVRDLFDKDGRAEYDYGNGHRVTRTRVPEGKRIVQHGHPGAVTRLWQPQGSPLIAESAVVMLAEGEKTADALVRLGAGCVATWAGGTSGVGKADYTPLAGRTAVIVPDNDEPGQKAMQTLVELLTPIAAEVKVWRVPAEYDGHPLNDAADLLLAGGSLDDLTTERYRVTEVGVGKRVTRGKYADIGALLAGGIPEPPAPTLARRSDGIGILYAGFTNSLVGDPESGKTWIMLAAAAEALALGKRALLLDVDHNGVGSIVSRLLAMGVPESILANPDKFRLAEPETPDDIAALVEDAAQWMPDLVGIDSVGEVLPIYGASSNSPDDFTRVHSVAIKPFATIGACVVLVDHLAKNHDSRSFGATGTAAKQRAISGVSLRVTVTEAFTPGVGGKAEITVIKDRHGGLRAHCPTGDREPLAGKFSMTSDDDRIKWAIFAPDAGEQSSALRVPDEDIAALDKLDPPPESIRDARARLGWRSDRTTKAMKAWRREGSVTALPGNDGKHGNADELERYPLPDPYVGNAVTPEEVGNVTAE